MEDEGHLGCPSESSFELTDNISGVWMCQEKWKFRLLFPRINGFEELGGGLGNSSRLEDWIETPM